MGGPQLYREGYEVGAQETEGPLMLQQQEEEAPPTGPSGKNEEGKWLNAHG